MKGSGLLTVLVLIALLIPVHCRPQERLRHRNNAKQKLKKCENTLDILKMQLKESETLSVNFTFDENVMLATGPATGQDYSKEPRYTLLISEVNLDNPGPNNKVFIELETIRRPFDGNPDDSDLEGHLLLVIQGEPLEVVTSVPIASLIRKVNKQFLVIGTKDVGMVDIDLSSTDVESIYGTQQVLPTGDDSPFAIAVLYSALQSDLFEVSLEKRDGVYASVSLRGNERLQQIISDNLVDILVVGRKTPTNHCKFFETLKPSSFVNPKLKTLLRDWDGPRFQLTGDLSLSRCCADKVPRDQECFRLSSPTAGGQNTCTNRRPMYLEKVIEKVTELNDDAPDEIMDTAECSADYPNVPHYRYGLLSDHNYAALVSEHVSQQMQCSEPNERVHAEPEENVLEENEMDIDDDRPPAVVPVFQFDTATFQFCKKFLPKTHEEILKPAITSWLEMIRHPDKCRFRCYMCSLYLKDGFRPDYKHATQMMTTGYYSGNKSRNKIFILDHANPINKKVSVIHAEAYSYVTALKRAKTADEIHKAKQDAHRAQKKTLLATMNAMKLSWAELRAEISFRSHPIFFDAVKGLGVNLGNQHSNHQALRFFAKAYADGFHHRLLKYLTEQQMPFSFMADATTNRNAGYLVCLIQTLEYGQPVLYFWRLIRLTKSESGLDMMNDIKFWIDKDNEIHDGFKSYFQENIIAFISDRGSPMVGKQKGLIARFKNYVGREVKSVACSAHKTETAIKHALGVVTNPRGSSDHQKKYFLKFGDLNNKIYSYYMSRGSKRWAHLVEIGDEIGVKTSRIKYHHTIRWSQSKRVAMETLQRDLDVIREDLDRTAVGSGDSQKKAKSVLDIVSDKSFCETLAEFVDLLSVSERMLDAFQKKHGLLLDIRKTLREGILRYEKLKSNPGKNLRDFLLKTSCPGTCAEQHCTLEQYDGCALVYYRTVVQASSEDSDIDESSSESDSELADDDDVDSTDPEAVNKLVPLEATDANSVPLSSWRSQLYERIVMELKTLFDVKHLESYDVIDPDYFVFSCPSTGTSNSCGNLESCYKSFVPIHSLDVPEGALLKWNRICKFYSVSNSLCSLRLQEWKIVLGKITALEKYQGLQLEKSISQFWSYAVSDSSLPWTEALLNLVRKILVTGQSSASAERAFSIMSRLKSSERSSLADDTVDDLIRIRFNGPEKIDDESLYEYTLQFLQSHELVDEEENGSAKEKKNQDVLPVTDSLHRSRIFSSLP